MLTDDELTAMEKDVRLCQAFPLGRDYDFPIVAAHALKAIAAVRDARRSLPWIPNVPGGERPKPTEQCLVRMRRPIVQGRYKRAWFSGTIWSDETASFPDAEVTHWLRITGPEGTDERTG